MPAPDPNAAPESLLVQKFSGLKNTVTAERLSPEELQVGLNIDLDDMGQARRRRGYALAAAGNYHSLFEGATATYVVRNDVLGTVNPDYSFVALRSGVGSDRLAYVQVGEDVYFSSRVTSGVVHSDTAVSDWGAVSDAATWVSPVVNPTSTLPALGGRLLGKPPMATALAYYNGRIFLADGSTVWATELYLYNYIDRTRTFLQFEAEVTMLAAVADGLYVGTTRDVWFLSGRLAEMKRVIALREGALPGSSVIAGAELLSTVLPNRAMTESKDAAVFMSTGGLCVGLSTGEVYNVTEDRVIFPDAVSVAAMVRQQDGISQYVGVADSGGSPSSTARIGGYMDAEIRRFQGV